MTNRFRTLAISAALLGLALPGEAKNFFELANQGFQDGGRTGLRSDTTFQFNGPIFVFEEPDYLSPKSGNADYNPDGPTIWVKILGGYDTNPAGTEAGDASWFGGAQLGISETWNSGPVKVFVGGRIKFLQYDDRIFRGGRDGNDRGIYDFDLRLGMQRQFSQSVQLTAFHDLNVGGIQEFGEPYILPGISRQDLLLYRAASQLVYRFDHAEVGAQGLQLTSALRGTFSKGLDNDDQDVQRSEFRQSVDYIVNPTLAVGLEGRVGLSNYDDWDDLDSSSYQALATASGRLASGIYFHLAAGWEWWAYQKDQLIDDRDDFYAELKISGEVTDNFYLAGGLFYGIDTVRPDRVFDSADPMALKAALTGVWENGLYTVTSLLTYGWYEADLLPYSDAMWDRWSAGISVDREIGSNSTIGASFQYANIDTDQDQFEDIETVLRLKVDF